MAAQRSGIGGSTAPIARRALLGAAALTAGAPVLLEVGLPADASPWTPLAIRGCDVWFNAANGVRGVASSRQSRSAGSAPELVQTLPNRAVPRFAARALTASATSVAGGPDQRRIVFHGAGGLTAASPNAPAAATYVAVIRQRLTRAGAFIGTGINGGNNGFEFRVNDDGTVTAARSGVWEIGTSSRRILAGRFNVVAFQYDTNGTWACYINGQSAGMGRTKFTLSRSRTSLALGYSFGSPTPAFRGELAEVIRYTRPLLGQELLHLHRYLATKWDVPLARRIDSSSKPPHLSGLVGSNVAPRLAQYSSGSVWTDFWSDWDWRWVKHSIDRARASGSNAIRTIGDVQAVGLGRLEQAGYLERLEQIIRYCRKHRVRYYPCGFSLQAVGSTSIASVHRQLVAQARLFARNLDVVVGFDLVNELGTNYDSYGRERAIGLALSLAAAVRHAAPAVPITVSDIGDLQWGALSRGTPLALYRRFAAHVDFFDVHVYAEPGDLRAWHLAPYELTVGKPLMIGEFGADASGQGESKADRYYRSVRALRDATPSVRGVFQWAAVDDRFGLQTETGARVRSRLVKEWRRF